MTVPRLGEGAFLGLGIDTPFTTNGAAASIELWAPLLAATSNLQQERDDIVLEDLLSRSDLTEGYFFPGQRRVTGTLVLEMNYDVVTEFLRAFTGHDVTPTGVGPYTYTFNPIGRDDTSHFMLGTTTHGMTIEVFSGGSFANSVFYSGAIPTELQLKFEPNGFAMLTVTFIARQASIGAKSTVAVTSPTKLAVTPTGQASAHLALESTTYVSFGTTVTLRNGLGFRHDVTAIETLLPVPEGKESADLTVDIEVPDDTFITKADAHTLIDNANTILLAKDSNNSIQVTFKKLKVVVPGEPRPQSHGPVRWSGSLRAVSDVVGAAPWTSVQVVNDQSDFIAS